jgi:hypothetical protein
MTFLILIREMIISNPENSKAKSSDMNLSAMAATIENRKAAISLTRGSSR